MEKENKEILEEIEIEEIESTTNVENIEDKVEDKSQEKKETSIKSQPNKKKLSKKAKVGIGIGGTIAGLLVVVLVAVFLILPLFSKNTKVGNSSKFLAVNGYQQYTDVSTINLREGANPIVSCKEMFDTTGLSLSNSTDIPQIAANLYNLAVTNYAQIDGTGWYCLTDSTVCATSVKAGILSVETFEVGIRAAYSEGVVESKTVQNENGKLIDNIFTQTISGVTVLDIKGIPSNITNTIKSSFGYNIQKMRWDNTFAFRRGPNGGAEYFDDNDKNPDHLKYLMGAYQAKFPTKVTDVKTSEKAFYIHDYNPETDNAATQLDYITTPNNVINERVYAWSPLNTYYEYAYKLKPYKDVENYYYGNYGTGWAVYDFSVENIDPSTTVTYNANTHVYTINLVVKENKADTACAFAKAGLTKDTKDYIQMQHAKYSLSKNIIEIYDNGLIKSWDRIEKVSSDQKALLKVLSGECKGGGYTENHTLQAFSYIKKDYDPFTLAAIYWPELGDASVVGSYAFDFSGYKTFAEYKPEIH